MQYTNWRFDGIDKPVSTLALGTAFYSLERADHWLELLDAFAAAGGTVIDSGRKYGESEAVLGQWFAERGNRDGVLLITKCGHGDNQLPVDGFEDMVAEEMATSLDNLGIGHVDLYMLHRDNPAMPVGRVMDRLHVEVAEGRARALGASNWTPARVDEANAYAHDHGLTPFAAVSNNLSLPVPAEPFFPGLVWTDPAAEAWHAERGMPLVVWSSQARGFFAGPYSPDERDDPPADLPNFTQRMYTVYGSDANFERRRRAAELGAAKGGFTAIEVGLAYVLRKPLALAPVVGCHSVEELGSCLRAEGLDLTEEECRWLNLEDAVANPENAGA